MFFTEKGIEALSILFGAGGIGYAIVSRILDRQKYKQEVRESESAADLKSDEFWKGRYEILQSEIENKDNWWKERYDALYSEFQAERKLSTEIVSSFRTELSQMRTDYEEQRRIERAKYDALMENYRKFEEDSLRRENEYKERITELERLVSEYEKRLNKD